MKEDTGALGTCIEERIVDRHMLTRDSSSPAYDNDEPDFDMDEPLEPYDPDEETHNPDGTALGEDQENFEQANVVESGDPSAAANRGKGKDVKDKKIAKENRTTTPYMTKYERARILGTRALQIR
jgi:DNA-directed RNA polymerase I, II, and III subunit RPABC2